jgi:hypothetical protein
MKTIKFESLEDKYFGKKGSAKRREYDAELEPVIKKLLNNHKSNIEKLIWGNKNSKLE